MTGHTEPEERLHANLCKKPQSSPHSPLKNLLICSTFWFWDWLLCFFPLRRLAEMENRNGSYLNDSISPNESMWEPLFLFVCFCVFAKNPPHQKPIGLAVFVCVWTGSVFSSFPLAGIVLCVSDFVYMWWIFWIWAHMIVFILFASFFHTSMSLYTWSKQVSVLYSYCPLGWYFFFIWVIIFGI